MFVKFEQITAIFLTFTQGARELFELEQKVAERYGLAGCVAFIDGTYVPLMTPGVNEAAFFCRKHYHALNVMVGIMFILYNKANIYYDFCVVKLLNYMGFFCLQIVCDADMRILAIDASYGGSHPDNTVLEMSAFGKRIFADKILGDYYIIGDNGCVYNQHKETNTLSI